MKNSKIRCMEIVIILTSDLKVSISSYFNYTQFPFLSILSPISLLQIKVTYFPNSTLIIKRTRAGKSTIIEEIGKRFI